MVLEGATSVWAQYTIRLPDRDKMADHLRQAGIPTAIYYPIPLHLQTGYRHHPKAPGDLAVSEHLAGEVLSLPMHPYLEAPVQDRIIEAVKQAVQN